MITSGEGKYQVWVEQKKIGEDLLFILGGGEKTHIGGVVVCVPGKKSNVVKIGSHYDHVVLQPLAEAACKKYNTKVVAVGGVHVDNASKEEIDLLVENCRRLKECI